MQINLGSPAIRFSSTPTHLESAIVANTSDTGYSFRVPITPIQSVKPIDTLAAIGSDIADMRVQYDRLEHHLVAVRSELTTIQTQIGMVLANQRPWWRKLLDYISGGDK